MTAKIFDAADIDYLASHLSEQQLQTEIRHATSKGQVNKEQKEYWEQFSRACALALVRNGDGDRDGEREST